MTLFSKFKDIEAVMQKAKTVLLNIEQEYSKCLQAKSIPDSLLVDIKDYLANLRTALDYLYNKIPNISGDYFPVANSEADFIAKTKNIEAKFSSILKEHQDYSQAGWLRCFNLFRNKNVHLTLIPQKRAETKEFSVKKAGVPENIATFRGCTFGGNGNHISMFGVPMPIDLKTQLPVDTQGLDIKRVIWVDFLFDGSLISSYFPEGISALPFLTVSLKHVSKIILTLEEKL